MKTFKLKNIFLGLGMLASVGCTVCRKLLMILYLRMDSIKPRRMFFRRLYVLSDTDIGCVVGDVLVWRTFCRPLYDCAKRGTLV